ncbi:MAG: helix-turn-helix domain-containing protein [Prevotella sp.]|nr:helix-turn-helix domain-containing protein [Prevotella sp.]
MEPQITLENSLFLAPYGGVMVTAIIACIYLLWRRPPEFVPTNTSPLRLRRWTAVFFATIAMSHLWWLLIYYTRPEGDPFYRILICSALDAVTTLPAILCTMLAMLQDRRRPQWPVAVVVAISLAEMLVIYVTGSFVSTLLLLLFSVNVVFIAFIFGRAVIEYGHWLRDTYADLEHKEVWQIFVVMAVFLLVSISYGLANDYFIFEVLVEVFDVLLIFFLLWRVETLRILDDHIRYVDPDPSEDPVAMEIESRLQQYCIEPQFYLRNNVTLKQLAKLTDIHPDLLIRHFEVQGKTYNTYINGLRIQHFIQQYDEAVASDTAIDISKIALACGFRNYTTFCSVFKQHTGQPIKEWMSKH